MKKQAALRLAHTRTLDRGQWLEIRKGGIGSSDAAAAVGLNPYKSRLELWLEKTGRAAANDDHQGMDDPRFWGTLLEPYVAVAYQQKTDHKVRKVNAVLQHPTFPFMLANIDREVVGSPDVQILECKTAGEFGSRLWRGGVPEYVELQVQHQLAVTGKEAADVAVLLCGQKLEVHRIERDEEVISRLVVLESQFWEYVITDTPPPADGSESAARALRHLYQGNDTTLDFTGNAELGNAFDALAELDQEIATKAREAERMKQVIQQAMGDASKAAFLNGVVTFKRAKDGARIDTKGLAAGHPDIAARYTVTTPGSRRFLLVRNNETTERSATC